MTLPGGIARPGLKVLLVIFGRAEPVAYKIPKGPKFVAMKVISVANKSEPMSAEPNSVSTK
jgi:hypothetical protein